MYDNDVPIESHIVADIVNAVSHSTAIQLLCQGYAVTWGSASVLLTVNAKGSFRIYNKSDLQIGRPYISRGPVRSLQPTMDEALLHSFMVHAGDEYHMFKAVKLMPNRQEEIDDTW